MGRVGWGRGLGRGQGTFYPPCHILHYHIVLRPEGTSHNYLQRSFWVILGGCTIVEGRSELSHRNVSDRNKFDPESLPASRVDPFLCKDKFQIWICSV